MVGYYYVTRPKLNSVFVSANKTRLFEKQVNIRYQNSDGKTFYQSNNSTYRALSKKEVSKLPKVVNALVATEDRDYFKESGVNWLHTAKAGIDTFLNKGVSGGSTITQQLIKLAFYSTSKKDQTIRRKIQEIFLAEELSKKYSKYQILTWYLNKTNYGNGQQGLVAASKYYYNKKPEQLNTLEAATLVGIVNSPSVYNPYANKKATLYRRNAVLLSMREAGYLKKGEYHKLVKESVDTNLVLAKTNVQDALNKRQQKLQYNGFVSAVNAQLSRYNGKLTNSTLTVKTTMNQGLQDGVNQIVKSQSYPDDKFQEAIVVINNKDGKVAAMSGGRNQTVLGGYNRAFNVKRSSGSSIKPLLDYATGFDLFKWTANTKVNDSAYDYPNSKTSVNDWDHHYQGNITIRQALVRSRNIPAVKSLAAVGLDNGQKALTALGLPNSNIYYANAIGLDTSPLALASAYSSLANGGIRTNARFVDTITNKRNHQMLKTKPVHERVFSSQTAYLITDILKGVFEPGGIGASGKVNNISEAGKTGTVGREDIEDALTDGWIVGYTKTYTVAVWVGYDNPNDKTNYLTEKKDAIAQELYKSVMTKASSLRNTDNSDWTAPSGVNDKTKSYDRGVNLSNNFTQAVNRENTYVPFYLTISPAQLLDTSGFSNDAGSLEKLYRTVNSSNK